MPRYLYNVRSSRRVYHDEEGGLSTSVDGAHVTAIMAAQDRLKDAINPQKRIEVCDEAGRYIAIAWPTSAMGL